MSHVSKSNLTAHVTGILSKDACVLIVRTEWNASIVDELQKGCIRQLEKAGIAKINVVTVPGAVEIPFAVKHAWSTARKKDRPSAIITLGCVLKGDTPHFDYVCRIVTDGVLQLNLSLPVPIIFGVLTVDNDQQAKERIGGIQGHKGEEAAHTALKMMAWMKSIGKKANNNRK